VLTHLLSVVVINLNQPKLLKPGLLLHLALENAKLRGDAERREEDLFFIEGWGLGDAFALLGTFMYGMCFVDGVFAIGLLLTVILLVFHSVESNI
jgi:hypothetical protein